MPLANDPFRSHESGSRKECRLSTNFSLLLDEGPKFGQHHFCMGYFQFNAYNRIWFSVGEKISKTVSFFIVWQSYQCVKSQRQLSSGLYTAAALYDILPISFLGSVNHWLTKKGYILIRKFWYCNVIILYTVGYLLLLTQGILLLFLMESSVVQFAVQKDEYVRNYNFFCFVLALDFRETGWWGGGGLDWIGLAVDGDSWRPVGNALINIWVS